MAYVLFGFLLVISTCTQVIQPLPEKCSPKWEIDWNIDVKYDSIFPSPGVIIGGKNPITVPDLVEFVGRLWNAKSPLELFGYVCRDYAPYIYALLNSGDELDEYRNELRTTCDNTISMLQEPSTADFQQYCLNESDKFQLETMVKNYVNQSLYLGQYCEGPSIDRAYLNTSNIICSLLSIGVENLFDVATTAYRVAFEVLDWLSPSPFSGDVFGGCSGLRLMSNMNIDNIVAKLETFVSYFVADGLMFFREYDGCDVVERTVIQRIDDTLFYGQRGGICGFLSGNPSENEYKTKAVEIVDNLLPVPSNTEQCVSILDWMVEQFEHIDDSFYDVTGSDISTGDGRIRFCNQLLESLSSNTPYTPEVYVFPVDQEFQNWYPFKVEGEFLPGFGFNDGMDLLGAILNSATVIDGADLVCRVFELFLTEITETTYPRRMCAAVRRDNTKSVENICREITVPLQYWYLNSPPVSLRQPTLAYVIVVGVDVDRKLFKLNEVSTNGICSAVDGFFNSDNNLGSIVELTLSGYYAELLPITDDICNDYDDVIRYLRSGSYLTSEEFTKLADQSTDLISALLGFSNSIEICGKISDGISESTGRSNEETISFFVDETLRFLTDDKRCVESIKAALPLLKTVSDVTVDKELIKTYTGFDDEEDLCKALSSSFVDECADSAYSSITSWYLMVSGLILAKMLSSFST